MPAFPRAAAQWLGWAPTLAYRCGGSTGFSPVSRTPGSGRYHSCMRSALLFLLVSLPAAAQVGVRDDYGNDVRLQRPAARIVSLSPHLTELLYAAGAGPYMVGA